MHLENFGSYVGDNGLAYFDLNDFDEAALAPVVYDPLRLLTDLFVLTGSFSLHPTDVEGMARFFIDVYADTLAGGKARWVERDTALGLVRDLLDGLRERTLTSMLNSRTDVKGARRRIRLDGIKALPASQAQKTAVADLLETFAAHEARPAYFHPLDIARRISGNASLGLERYIILVHGDTGRKTPERKERGGNALLDLKLATPSVLAAGVKNKQPAWKSEAERIVVAQTHMQAMPVAFLHALRMGRKRSDHSLVLRALQPGQDRVELSRCRGKPKRLAKLLGTMAQALAWAQLRASSRQGAAHVDELIAFAERRPWRTQLIALARQCSAQVETDWKNYAAAYQKGF
jgi:uncharacterized protein (DUF2252 family)